MYNGTTTVWWLRFFFPPVNYFHLIFIFYTYVIHQFAFELTCNTHMHVINNIHTRFTVMLSPDVSRNS